MSITSSSVVPTVHLQNLFNDLDFLGSAKEDEKPCFRDRSYMNKHSWIGTIHRTLNNESQSDVGNGTIYTICLNASQTYDSYKNNKNFGDILLDKIVKARIGLERIARTYESICKSAIARELRNNSILILDSIIPEDRKQKEDLNLTQSINNNINNNNNNNNIKINDINKSNNNSEDFIDKDNDDEDI
tara:strand:- start:367 stop:930 length:564 start_codon:yes stop_codon:yes gene_type:complete